MGGCGSPCGHRHRVPARDDAERRGVADLPPNATITAASTVHDHAARAAMCSVCGRRRACPSAVRGEMVLLSVGAERRAPLLCPIGRFPDADGTVRWLGVRWLGVPWPVRVYVGLRAAARVLHSYVGTDRRYGGCGCIARLRAVVTRAARTARR